MAVAHGQLVFEGEGDVLAGRPAARGDGVADAEAEARDGGREGRFGEESGVDDVCFRGVRVGGGTLGGEESDGRVVGGGVAGGGAECEAVLDESGGCHGDFDGEGGAGEDGGGGAAD